MAIAYEASQLQARIWDVLATIDDPEMPISIVDLGLVVDVCLAGGIARIRLTPTYTGCVALDMIDQTIRQKVSEIPGIQGVEVERIFDPPWTPTRISQAGRKRLQAHGVTVADTSPKHPSAHFVPLTVPVSEKICCPYCHSQNTRLDSQFGPTRCRAILYCLNCHSPFEHIKTV